MVLENEKKCHVPSLRQNRVTENWLLHLHTSRSLLRDRVNVLNTAYNAC